MSNDLLLILFAFCFKVIVFTRLVIGQHSCHEDASCFGDTISTSSDVQCYGYLSCSTASIASSGSYVYCDGSYSCFNTTHLIATSSSTDLYCRGLHSCAFINLISAAWIGCEGEGSCYGGIVYANNILYCRGARSCAETTIYVNDSVHAHGYASLKNSEMFSNATTT